MEVKSFCKARILSFRKSGRLGNEKRFSPTTQPRDLIFKINRNSRTRYKNLNK